MLRAAEQQGVTPDERQSHAVACSAFASDRWGVEMGDFSLCMGVKFGFVDRQGRSLVPWLR